MQCISFTKLIATKPTNLFYFIHVENILLKHGLVTKY